MTIAMIVAIGHNGEIGLDGKLPWGHVPEDMKRFVRLTSGHAVLMGRKTHESIGRLLSDRQNFVATRQGNVLPGAIAVHDLQEFLETWRDSDKILWVIGGAELYSYAEPYAQKLEITRLSGYYKGDTYFPPMHWPWWERTACEAVPSFSNPNINGIVFQTWEKVPGWNSPLYNHDAARTNEQRAEMERLEQARQCHFCSSEEPDKIILENAHWFAVNNTFPYDNTALHLLVVPKKHYLSLSEMPDEFRQSYLEIVAAVEEHFELKAYSHFMRVGTMTRTGASIAHLHAHIIVGNPDAQDEPVRVKLAT